PCSCWVFLQNVPSRINRSSISPSSLWSSVHSCSSPGFWLNCFPCSRCPKKITLSPRKSALPTSNTSLQCLHHHAVHSELSIFACAANESTQILRYRSGIQSPRGG